MTQSEYYRNLGIMQILLGFFGLIACVGILALILWSMKKDYDLSG